MEKKKKKSNVTRIVLILIAVFVVLVGLAAALRAAGVFGSREEGEAVEVADAEIRNITQTVTASGKIQPEVEVKISPDVPGEIIALPVHEGDRVDQGALLVRIRPDNYLAEVERNEASVLQSKAVLAQRRADVLNAELELNRQKDLFEKQAISESEYQRAKTQYDVAVAAYEAADYAVQSADAQLKDAREQLAKTSIYSPMSGTISILNVELGERVVGTSQMEGTEMMRVAKLDQMEIEVDVNENDVVNITVLDSAIIEIDAYPERQFNGSVTEIANSARVTAQGTQEQVTNFPVKIRITNPHNIAPSASNVGQLDVSSEEIPLPEVEIPNFRPGMSGTVDIYTKTVHDAVVVPIQSVTVRDFNEIDRDDARGDAAPEDDSADAGNDEGRSSEDEAGENGEGDGNRDEAGDAESQPADMFAEDLRKVVFVFDENKARMVEVTTGISDDTHIEIKSGLAGDERVIIGPYRVVSRTLEPGDAVRIEERGPRGGPSFTRNN